MDWSYLIQAGKEGLAERVFTHNAATVGATVGVAINADPTAFASTEAMLVLDNTANASSGDNQWIIPVSIDMYCTAGGDGTFWALRMTMDNATQYSSGGTTLAAAQCSYDTRSGYSDRTPKGKAAFGDLTLAGGSSRKVIGDFGVQAGPDGFTAGDKVHLRFGSLGGAGDLLGSYVVSSTQWAQGGKSHVVNLPPIWIGRQCSLFLQPLATVGSSAVSFHPVIVTVELGHPRETA